MKKRALMASAAGRCRHEENHDIHGVNNHRDHSLDFGRHHCSSLAELEAAEMGYGRNNHLPSDLVDDRAIDGLDVKGNSCALVAPAVAGSQNG